MRPIKESVLSIVVIISILLVACGITFSVLDESKKQAGDLEKYPQWEKVGGIRGNYLYQLETKEFTCFSTFKDLECVKKP